MIRSAVVCRSKATAWKQSLYSDPSQEPLRIRDLRQVMLPVSSPRDDEEGHGEGLGGERQQEGAQTLGQLGNRTRHHLPRRAVVDERAARPRRTDPETHENETSGHTYNDVCVY